MTDLSREELRAHLSAVEAQVRAALRIIAAESKSVQQAHSALRADLSAALIRLQGEISAGNSELENKVDRAITDVNSLSKTRKMTSVILGVMVLIFGITVGLLAGGGYYILQDQIGKNSVDTPKVFGSRTPQIERPTVSVTPPPIPSFTSNDDTRGVGGSDVEEPTAVTPQPAPNSGFFLNQN